MNIEKNRAALRRPRKLAARPGGRLERCLLICGIVGYTVLLCFTLFKTSSIAKSVLNAH